jgi:hypothetical protein
MGFRPSELVTLVLLSLASGACSGPEHPAYITDAPPSGNAGARGDDGSSSGSSDAGSDSGTTPGPRTATLEKILEGAPWELNQQTTGFAADSTGRVFVMDPKHIYVVEGADVSVFLTIQETVDQLGLATYYKFTDLDIGADDTLYISLGDIVVTAPAPKTVAIWGNYVGEHQWSGSYTTKMAVIDDHSILIIEGDGLYRLDHEDATLLYSQDAEGRAWDSDCASHDLAASRAGVFLYQPGCTGSSLLKGQADGSGTSVLYETNLGDDAKSPLNSDDFECVARDPSGGFYAVVDNYFSETPGVSLYHLTDDVTSTSGYALVPLSPSLTQAKMETKETFAFDYCSLAVAPDGTIYFQTFSQLWKITP